MVTLGFRATSPESQKARKISVMKKILEERSKMFSHDVCFFVEVGDLFLMMGWKINELEVHRVHKVHNNLNNA